VLGILLAWLYERTGSLWLPIMLHVVNNAIAFAVLTST
jgi:membrane protease YdiL (CAAX protease family)